MRGGDELVGMCLDPDGRPDQHRLHHGVPAGESDPEWGVSRGRLLPAHQRLDGRAGPRTGPAAAPELQEALARRQRSVTYRVVTVEGPPHERRFTCAAVIDGEEAGIGSGRTKKDAEQAAAREALAALG